MQEWGGADKVQRREGIFDSVSVTKAQSRAGQAGGRMHGTNQLL